MNTTAAALDLLYLILAALVPSLIFLAWVRSSERYQKEPWAIVLSLFAYGAIFATIVAGILELILVDAGTAASKSIPAPEFSFLNGNSTAGAFFLALVIAPFVEEGLKASGVLRYRAKVSAMADGPVFGASVGLGFGFFETFLYGVGAFLTGGLIAGLSLIFIRSLSSVLLHGSSTAMFGYGVSSSKLEGRGWATGGYYLVAVGMHSSFNVLASLGAIVLALGYSNTIGTYADLAGLGLAIVFAIAAINHVVSVIHSSQFPAAGGTPSRYRPPSIARRQPPPGPR
jgi:protease PrsW